MDVRAKLTLIKNNEVKSVNDERDVVVSLNSRRGNRSADKSQNVVSMAGWRPTPPSVA